MHARHKALDYTCCRPFPQASPAFSPIPLEPENPMKALLFVVSLAAVLTALPASAQLGPAGVPGAPGLAETDPSVKSSASASPSTPQAQHTQQKKHASAKCSQNKEAAQCKGRKIPKKANDACKGKTGEERKQCRQEQAWRKECNKSADPARCEQHKKAAQLCQEKLGAEHRQCLHENLLPKN